MAPLLLMRGQISIQWGWSFYDPGCEKSRRILERLGQRSTLVVESPHTGRYLSTVMMLEKDIRIVSPPTFLGLTFLTGWTQSGSEADDRMATRIIGRTALNLIMLGGL